MKSCLEISADRLAGNYRALVEVAGADMPVMAVIKANAYGHGLAQCAPVLIQAGAQWLGIADATEGAAVRAMVGEAPRILVMSGLQPEDAEAIVRHRLTPVVWTRDQIEWLAEAARQQRAGAPFNVHLEIDTGMARQGVAPGEELHSLLTWLTEQKALHVEGVMTHFASAEVADSALTLAQRERFEQALSAIAAAGLRPSWVHAANSSTIDNSSSHGRDCGSLIWLRQAAAAIGAQAMARTGIALYGYCLPVEGAESLAQPKLRPVMTWKSRIIAIRNVNAGDTVGYNAAFTAPHAMRLALLPVGYSDGLRRELSSTNSIPGGWVIVRGKRANIIGRVSMNLTVVDVTEISDAEVNDEVVLLGNGITADDHARLAHTISYEILCGIQGESRLV
ncbi:MAG TPA: alanine racemase [Edaphobacter sp.]|nr:alanine racemase [Edaphobacter sp.]